MSPNARLAMEEFDYDLPPELIAQEPLEHRSASRLMTLDRTTGRIGHRHFGDIVHLLRPGDLVVANDSRVIPARIAVERSTGGKGEILLLRRIDAHRWVALARPSRRLARGEVLTAASKDTEQTAHVTILDKLVEGQVVVELNNTLAGALGHFGTMPLPPYITHRLADEERYQTVYSHPEGSAAAPTAGLHFTHELLTAIEVRGVELAYVTLHVGLDTFRPVNETYAEDHAIHSEWCSVPPSTWDAIQRAQERGGRIVAVGTTSARTLETLGQRIEAGKDGPFDDFTQIYITPGYRWTMVDALITNFHLPKSTLLLMISSFAGREHVLRAYQAAIDERYRFFSFGDAMFIADHIGDDEQR